MRSPSLACFLVLVSACGDEDEPNWVQFNATDDQVTVEVGAAEEKDAVSSLLHSNTGEVEIGEGSVEPGGGPIGTEHAVVVVVYDEWENEVERATVRIDSGSRGKDEYEMESDMADEGTYKLVIVSVGDEGETRDDVFTFRLWYDDNEEQSEGGDTGS